MTISPPEHPRGEDQDGCTPPPSIGACGCPPAPFPADSIRLNPLLSPGPHLCTTGHWAWPGLGPAPPRELCPCPSNRCPCQRRGIAGAVGLGSGVGGAQRGDRLNGASAGEMGRPWAANAPENGGGPRAEAGPTGKTGQLSAWRRGPPCFCPQTAQPHLKTDPFPPKCC